MITWENFNYLAGNDIEPVIKTRKDASTKAKGSPSRAKMLREVRRLGYEGCRDKYRYGDRWMVETFFSGVKREFGETVKNKNYRMSQQRNEISFLTVSS